MKKLDKLLQEYFQQDYTRGLPISERFRLKKNRDPIYTVWCVNEKVKRLSVKKQKIRRTVEGYPLNIPKIERIVDGIQHENGVKGLQIFGAFHEDEFKTDYKKYISQHISDQGSFTMTMTCPVQKAVATHIQEIPTLLFMGHYKNQDFWNDIRKMVKEEIILSPWDYREIHRKLSSIKKDNLDESIKQHTQFMLDLGEDLHFDCGITLRPSRTMMSFVKCFPLEFSTKDFGEEPLYILRLSLGHHYGYTLKYWGPDTWGRNWKPRKKPYTHPILNFYLMGPSAVKELEMIAHSWSDTKVSHIRAKIRRGESINTKEKATLQKLRSEINLIEYS